ncbi:PSMD8 [Bugula neritina]|uniref:PSMD8 n=1 Tax=Bugula neritina TaxID=10212 RepID=A0A7J7KCH4_BUGNE|nr:PSMD8 [Bugula neritina]
MEGSYNKVFVARGNVPAETYTFFMNILVGTIRGWVVTPDNHFIFKQKDHTILEPINSVDLAQQAISYARELEMII